MKANHGIALPFVVVTTAMLALAVMSWLPSDKGRQLQQIRFKHLTWWHWQQAVAHYHAVTGQWPDDLTDVKNEFGLADPPQFIEGYALPDGFSVRLTGINKATEKTIVRELMPYVDIRVAGTLDIDLTPSSNADAVPNSLISRYHDTSMATGLDLNDFDINNVAQITITDEFNLAANLSAPMLVTEVLSTQQIDQPGSLQATYVHTTTELNIFSSLYDRITTQYNKLESYMSSNEAVASRPCLNIGAVHCEDLWSAQHASAQGANRLWRVGER